MSPLLRGSKFDAKIFQEIFGNVEGFPLTGSWGLTSYHAAVLETNLGNGMHATPSHELLAVVLKASVFFGSIFCEVIVWQNLSPKTDSSQGIHPKMCGKDCSNISGISGIEGWTNIISHFVGIQSPNLRWWAGGMYNHRNETQGI